MARNYSAQYKGTLAEVSPEEAPLVLLEINHPALTAPVRVVNDMQDLTSNGNLYIACPFRFVPPDDFENQLPKAKLAVDNVGRDLMYWIETTSGGQGSTVTAKYVMRSRPDTVELSITMNLYNVQTTMKEVMADMGFDNLFAKPAVGLQYRPNTAPGIF